MSTDSRERFWNLVCGFRRMIINGFVLTIVLLFLSLVSLLYVTRGTSHYVVLQIDFAVLITLLVGQVYAIWKCQNR